MKRGFVVAVGGAAIVIAGLSGCSSDDKKSESSGSSTASSASGTASVSATAAPSGGGTKVTIDGKDQNVAGTVVCTAMGGNMNIAIGEAATGIAAVVSEDGSNVTSVGLGNVNGVTLGYQSGTGQGEAKATKDGNKWTITGTATGIDMANPMQPVNKPFEIDVTCP
ncbi:lipoprotein LpqH [Mycobacterium sp. OAS707]|uniref:lipoprotein LpqH n=1 Tax=Mycobacterium sp. OAS707 TaxID=2663822 RepID=UPI00178B335E